MILKNCFTKAGFKSGEGDEIKELIDQPNENWEEALIHFEVSAENVSFSDYALTNEGLETSVSLLQKKISLIMLRAYLIKKNLK